MAANKARNNEDIWSDEEVLTWSQYRGGGLRA